MLRGSSGHLGPSQQVQIFSHLPLQGQNRILKLSQAHGSKAMERSWQTKELYSTVIPNVILLAKDHMKHETNDDPKTTPVCYCSRSLNQEISEYISDMPEAAMNTKG